MDYGLYISAAGADVQSRRMDTISNNLANVGTPGFKRELSQVQSRYAEAIEEGLVQPGLGTTNDVGGGVRIHETMTEFAQGVLKQTGTPTDAAIVDTPGQEMAYFAVEKEGVEYLTRAGNFLIAPSGELQTPQGYRVLAADGGPLAIDPDLPPGDINFSEQGGLRQAGIDVGFLKLVRPASGGDLVHVGENLFKPLADVEAVPPADRNIAGGFLEMSAVNSYREMLQMIETSRAYESNVRMIQYQDGTVGTLISRVMRQS